MKKVPLSVVLVILTLVVLSCGLADRLERVTGSDKDFERTSELWTDVPRIDGLDPSEMEMPIAIKVIMRTVLNNLWRLNKEGEGDKTPVSGDWIVFTTAKTPVDVQDFYTNDRMTSFGSWEESKKSTCLDGKESGIDGALCVFKKVANGKDIGLAIIALKDDSTKQTNLFFLRVEQDAKPDAVNTAPIAEKKKGPITPLTGSAPYGIEKRPMPTGLDIEILLPKKVGPYERVLVEKSEQRGTTADEIKLDGNSVYATYRNGDKEIFVEFAVSSSAKDAQESLDIAAADVTGTFPSDPNLGSIGTEPSYVKITNESGAFIAWTRAGYFFTANAKGGEADLDAFMNAFPY
jgi:hypothetical protein